MAAGASSGLWLTAPNDTAGFRRSSGSSRGLRSVADASVRLAPFLSAVTRLWCLRRGIFPRQNGVPSR